MSTRIRAQRSLRWREELAPRRHLRLAKETVDGFHSWHFASVVLVLWLYPVNDGSRQAHPNRNIEPTTML